MINEEKLQHRLYKCDMCGAEVITQNVLISGIPHCSKEKTFTFVKIIEDNVIDKIRSLVNKNNDNIGVNHVKNYSIW